MKFQKKTTTETKKYEEKTNGAITLRVYESGFASLSIDANGGSIIVNGHIREGKEGFFFSYPSEKTKDGKYFNYAYALGDSLRADIESLVNELVQSE